jgi:hypothetical protein
MMVIVNRIMYYAVHDFYINRVRGPMARRLTTNQEIAGSIPAVLIFCFCRTS